MKFVRALALIAPAALASGVGQGMQRQRARGLMWLGLARDAIKDPQKDAWVRDLWEKDNAAANDADRQVAHVYASEFGRKKN